MGGTDAAKPSRKKLIAVIAGAAIMVAAALAFYINWQQDVERSSKLYEESPDLMINAESEIYNMTKGETIEIPIIIEIDQRGKEVNAKIAVFGNEDADIPKEVFAETSEKTLPPGFVGSLDRSTIHLPAAEQTVIKTETLLLTLTSKDDATSGDYTLSPTLFSNDIEGTPFTVSSSFLVHIE